MNPDDTSPLRTGVELTLKQLQSVLESLGLVINPSVGSAFDPTFSRGAMTMKLFRKRCPKLYVRSFTKRL